ncbi:MAG: T9SS type A sorting domain-containing protein [Ignavibacteria bacterium]|nr:T9SS type A sorting domain-containing protein [Ignavibacteria bacterium]
MTLDTKSRTISENKRWKILLIVAAFFLYQNIFTQSITWQRLYNGPYNQQDICSDICHASNGNFFAIGSSKKPTTQGYFIYVIKFNAQGDTLWTRIIDSLSNEAISCAETGDGGVVIVGEGHFALKLDSAGNIAWKKVYNLSGIKCFDIIRTTEGKFLACGEHLIVNGSTFRYDSYVMELDLNGNLLWDTSYLALFDKPLNSVIEIAGQGYIFTGYERRFIGDTNKCLVLRTNKTGSIAWEKNMKILSRGAIGKKVQQLGNTITIAGGTTDETQTLLEVFFLRLDYSGNIVSQKLLISNASENLTSFEILNQNRYALTSYNTSDIAKSIVSDTNGVIIYERSYVSSYYTFLFSVLPLSNGDILWGGAGRFTIEDADVWIIRTDSLLNSPQIAVDPISTFVPSKYQLYQNYPNPFNPATKIKFDISGSSAAQTSLSVYDITGKEISLLVNADLKPGSYEISFDASGLSSGVYFYKISTGSFTDVKKMVLLK